MAGFRCLSASKALWLPTQGMAHGMCSGNFIQTVARRPKLLRHRPRYESHRVQAFASTSLSEWQQRLASNAPARVSVFTGLYITLVGIALATAPFQTFGILFSTSVVARGWIQVGGILAMLFGIYYLGTGIGDVLGMGAKGFYMSTILGRAVLSLAFAWLAGAKAVPQGILALAAVNLIGAVSMGRALLQQSAAR